jgi:hypothetical protein
MVGERQECKSFFPFNVMKKSAKVLNRSQSKHYRDSPLPISKHCVMFPRFLEFGWYIIDLDFWQANTSLCPKETLVGNLYRFCN